MVAYLAEYDLSKFDPKAPPRKTDAFWQIVGAGAAPENSELADILDALGAKEKAKDAEGNPCGPVVTTLAKVLGEAPGRPVRMAERPQEPPRDAPQVRGLRVRGSAQPRCKRRAVGHRRQAAGGLRPDGRLAGRADQGSPEAGPKSA